MSAKKTLDNLTIKNKTICLMYRNGISISDISKFFKCNNHTIYEHLQRCYKVMYGEEFYAPDEIKRNRAKELYEKFKEIYKPFVYTRKNYCDMLECSIVELEYMFNKYKISHLRAKTYKTQRSLCNVPETNYEEYFNYCKNNNISIRKLAMCALNDFVLKYPEFKKYIDEGDNIVE